MTTHKRERSYRNYRRAYYAIFVMCIALMYRRTLHSMSAHKPVGHQSDSPREPLWFATFDGYTHAEGNAFCRRMVQGSVCPMKMYCPEGFGKPPHHGVRPDRRTNITANKDELWAPVREDPSDKQNLWVGVGANLPCTPRGSVESYFVDVKASLGDEKMQNWILCCPSEKVKQPPLTSRTHHATRFFKLLFMALAILLHAILIANVVMTVKLSDLAIHWTIVGGILMHLPGLQVIYDYQTFFEFTKTVLAAALEGTFLLLLLTWLHIKLRRKRSAVTLVGALLGVGLMTFVLSSIIGDATFRTMSGNSRPSTEMIVGGLVNAKQHVTAQFTADSKGASGRLVSALVCFVGSILLQAASNRAESVPHIGRLIYLLGVIVFLTSILGSYSPVIFASYSCVLSINLKRGGNASRLSDAGDRIPTKMDGPNFIYIQHESLSGAVMNTDEGKAAMPFFQGLKDNNDMYVFEHTRCVSGNTIDALPSLLTGCLPYNDEGEAYRNRPNHTIAHDFESAGYATGLFTSRAPSMLHGSWEELASMLVEGMSQVFDPVSLNLELVNEGGSDDRKLLPSLRQWIGSLKNHTDLWSGEVPRFYAQMYGFNNHYPGLKDPEHPLDEYRYFSSLRTVDELLNGVFDILEETGNANNTIIIGAGDHGDDNFKGHYVRVSALNPNVLHSAAYMYIPSNLLSEEERRTLRSNTKKLTHALDMFPTMKTLMQLSNGGEKYDFLTKANHGCFTGVDLTSVEVPGDRVQIAMDYVSGKKFVQAYNVEPGHLWAIVANETALYHRKWHSPNPFLEQGKDDVYVMHFGNCTSDTQSLCTEPFDLNLHGGLLKSALRSFKSTKLVGEGAKNSDLIQYFEQLLHQSEDSGG